MQSSENDPDISKTPQRLIETNRASYRLSYHLGYIPYPSSKNLTKAIYASHRAIYQIPTVTLHMNIIQKRTPQEAIANAKLRLYQDGQCAVRIKIRGLMALKERERWKKGASSMPAAKNARS